MSKEVLISWLVKTILAKVSEEDLKHFADLAIDFLEDFVEKSPNKSDDIIIVPMCKLVRTAFAVKDNDE